MRRLTILLVICTGFLFNVSVVSAQKDFDSALEYMKYISEEYKDLTKRRWKYTKSVAREQTFLNTMERRRRKLVDQHKEAIEVISEMSGYKGNTAYRDSVLSYLKTSKHIIKKDYDKIMDMKKIARESYDKMEAYLSLQEKVNAKLSRAGNMMMREQKKFADKHDINLRDKASKREKKLEKANDMFDYYNDFYLLFFKCRFEERKFLQAMKDEDISTMEQAKSSLLEYAQEGLDTLNKLGDYKGNPDLKNACRDVLTFFKDEAKNEMGKLTDFFLAKEKFDKIRETVENTSKSDRTKRMINKYKDARRRYERKVEKFNHTNEELNDRREEKIEEWMDRQEDFKEEYV